jgi:hypothetical protein
MEMYAADYGPDTYNIPTSPLFWGAVIFVALLVVACLLVVGKRNRRRFDGRPMEKGHTKDPRFDQTLFDQTLADIWHQTDEFPPDQTRRQRDASKERRKAREKAQKHQNKS